MLDERKIDRYIQRFIHEEHKLVHDVMLSLSDLASVFEDNEPEGRIGVIEEINGVKKMLKEKGTGFTEKEKDCIGFFAEKMYLRGFDKLVKELLNSP